jgi:hypothetical protein
MTFFSSVLDHPNKSLSSQTLPLLFSSTLPQKKKKKKKKKEQNSIMFIYLFSSVLHHPNKSCHNLSRLQESNQASLNLLLHLLTSSPYLLQQVEGGGGVGI